MGVLGSTQRRRSEMSRGKSDSWLKGISELTKSGEYRQYTTIISREWFGAGIAHRPCLA